MQWHQVSVWVPANLNDPSGYELWSQRLDQRYSSVVNDKHRLVRTSKLPSPWFIMPKSSVLRFSKCGVFQERGTYRRKIREKRGVFIESKSIANSEKASKWWAFEAMPYRAYESSFGVNGGEEGIRTLGTENRTHAFQACTFSHSVTSPRRMVCHGDFFCNHLINFMFFCHKSSIPMNGGDEWVTLLPFGN